MSDSESEFISAALAVAESLRREGPTSEAFHLSVALEELITLATALRPPIRQIIEGVAMCWSRMQSSDSGDILHPEATVPNLRKLATLGYFQPLEFVDARERIEAVMQIVSKAVTNSKADRELLRESCSPWGWAVGCQVVANFLQQVDVQGQESFFAEVVDFISRIDGELVDIKRSIAVSPTAIRSGRIALKPGKNMLGDSLALCIASCRLIVALCLMDLEQQSIAFPIITSLLIESSDLTSPIDSYFSTACIHLILQYVHAISVLQAGKIIDPLSRLLENTLNEFSDATEADLCILDLSCTVLSQPQFFLALLESDALPTLRTLMMSSWRQNVLHTERRMPSHGMSSLLSMMIVAGFLTSATSKRKLYFATLSKAVSAHSQDLLTPSYFTTNDKEIAEFACMANLILYQVHEGRCEECCECVEEIQRLV